MFPAKIQSRIEELLHETPRGELKARVKQFQTEYRQSKIGKNDPINDALAALAYACVRMPATYQAARHVLNQLHTKIENPSVQSCLDIGTGTGAVLHQLQQSFPDAAHTALEPNAHMRALAAQFCDDSDIEWATTDLRNFNFEHSYDLITIGYVLNEIKNNQQELLSTLWRATKKYLIIIETGSPKGFDIISSARDFIIQNGGFIVAPCPHQHTCPLVGNTARWCHFEERVARSRIHKELKEDAARGYEDEPFTYLIASREPQPQSDHTARLISRVHGTKILSADLCCSNGTANHISTTRKDEIYPTLRRAEWGDEINVPVVPQQALREL